MQKLTGAYLVREREYYRELYKVKVKLILSEDPVKKS